MSEKPNEQEEIPNSCSRVEISFPVSYFGKNNKECNDAYNRLAWLSTNLDSHMKASTSQSTTGIIKYIFQRKNLSSPISENAKSMLEVLKLSQYEMLFY